MNKFDVLLAKSYDTKMYEQTPPTYARLVPHVRAVEVAGESIVEVAGELILQNLDLPIDPWLSRLRRAVKVAVSVTTWAKQMTDFKNLSEVKSRRNSSQFVTSY